MKTYVPLLAAALALGVAAAGMASERPGDDPPPGTIAAAMQERRKESVAASGEIDVTAVSTPLVAFDKNGGVVLNLRPEELIVLEDGDEATILDLAPGLGPERPNELMASDDRTVPGAAQVQPPPWRVVVYVGTELAGRFVLSSLCRKTAEEASRLTDLGPVQVVVADPTPTLLLEGERRPEGVRSTLEQVASETTGLTTVERIRTAFAKEFRPGVGFDRQYTITQSSPQTYATRARAAALRERTVIRGELDRMVAWIERQPPEARGLLVWMTGGFDLNPADFYLPLVEQIDPSLATILRSDYSSLSLEDDVERMVEVALSFGWTVVPVNLSRSNFVFGAEVGGAGKQQHIAGVGANAIDTQQSEFRQVAPNYPLQLIARATGGEFVANDGQLGRALDHIRGAYLLTYQVQRPVDGQLHRLEVRCSRPGVRLRGRRFSTSGSLRGVSTTRARSLLAGDEIHGTLEITAAVHNITTGGGGQHLGELDVSADLVELRSALEPADLGRMRVTVVVEMGRGEPFVHHQELDIDWERTGPTWFFGAGIKWPKKAGRMAVVVEELVSSTWGAEVVELQ